MTHSMLHAMIDRTSTPTHLSSTNVITLEQARPYLVHAQASGEVSFYPLVRLACSFPPALREIGPNIGSHYLEGNRLTSNTNTKSLVIGAATF